MFMPDIPTYKPLRFLEFRIYHRHKKRAAPIGAALSLSKKSSNGWAFSYLDGIINMGDERCWNAEKWIAES